MAETKVNPDDPSTNGPNGTKVNADDPSINGPNGAYDNAAYPAGATAPIDALMVQPMTTGVPVTTMITRQAPPKPKSFIVLNTMMLLCCCPIFGIIALIKSSQVNILYHEGHYEAAEAASLSAKKWFNWGMIVGTVLTVGSTVVWLCLMYI